MKMFVFVLFIVESNAMGVNAIFDHDMLIRGLWAGRKDGEVRWRD